MNQKLHFPSPLDKPAVDIARLHREAFESSTDCLAFYELDEDNRLRVHEANPAFELLLGLSRNELLGRYLDELLSKSTAHRIGASDGLLDTEKIPRQLIAITRCVFTRSGPEVDS